MSNDKVESQSTARSLVSPVIPHRRISIRQPLRRGRGRRFRRWWWYPVGSRGSPHRLVGHRRAAAARRWARAVIVPVAVCRWWWGAGSRCGGVHPKSTPARCKPSQFHLLVSLHRSRGRSRPLLSQVYRSRSFSSLFFSKISQFLIVAAVAVVVIFVWFGLSLVPASILACMQQKAESL